MKVTFVNSTAIKSGVAALLAGQGGVLSEAGSALDAASGGQLSLAIKATKFEAKKDQVLDIVAPSGLNLDRVLIVGIGEPGKWGQREAELTGGTIAGALQGAKAKDAVVLAMPPSGATGDAAALAAALASGALLRAYSFDRYKTKKPDAAPKLVSLTVSTPAAAEARRRFAANAAVAEGVHLARDLVNEPANVLYPDEFARRARSLRVPGLQIEVLTTQQMKKLGMNALLGVAQGSVFEPRIVVMRWNGGRRGTAPLAFIGKGVTFDTGGISIKPAAGMEDMKGDMAGAACVTGLMTALARRNAKVNAVGVIGLVENAVDGRAQRPGDVVTSMSGQTIAVLNTDAEGRLVLADVLWYAQDRFKPKFMIDLATLTGAIMVALGKEHAGLFSNNDELAGRLLDAGLATGEKVWRMPLTPEYDKLIDSDIADMKNIGGRFGGAITGAQFIQRFVNNVPWAHLDIAGTAMDSIKSPLSQGWASGWGVRLLDRLVADYYER